MKPKQLAAIAALSTLSLVVACSGGNGGGAGQTGSSMLPVTPMAADSFDANIDIANAKSKIKLTPSKLNFTGTGKSAAKKVAISEKNYKGTFDLVSTCAKSVSMTPKKPKGPTGSITVTPLDAVTCTITISDKAKNKATLAVSVKLPASPSPSPSASSSPPAAAIVNGNFASGKLSPGWTACSFVHPGYAAAVNASPAPAGTGTQNNTNTPALSAQALTFGNSVGTPPPNYNPSITGPTLPAGLSANAAMTGDQNSQQIGSSGICQTFTVPASATNLSFWAYEGGSEYAFYYADQEADVMTTDGTTIQKTLFAEDNCFWDPGKVGATGYLGSGCIPSAFGGDPNNYHDWQGGYWVQRGPYDLSAYAGKSITLFLGIWASPSVNETSPYPDTYSQEMWVTNVQMSSSSTFPTTFAAAKTTKT
jgi:hypothetical protein